MCVKEFAAPFDLNVSRLALCVLGTTSQKSSSDKFIDPLFVRGKSASINVVNWVDRWMCLVVVATQPRRPEATIKEALGISSPVVVLYLLSNQRFQVKVLRKLVSFCSRVADP